MKISHLLKSGILVAILIGLGRISGFGRELLIAANFGASQESDLAILILTTPDILINLLIGGALGVVLVPDLKSFSYEVSIKYYQKVMLLIASIFFLIWAILALIPIEILSNLGRSIMYEELEVHKNSIRISFLAIPLAACSGVTIAFLHSQKKFLSAAASTLIFNTIIIIALLIVMYSVIDSFVALIGFSVFLGATLKWLIQIYDSKKVPFSFNPINIKINYYDFFSRYLMGLSCLGLLSLFPIYLRTLISENGEGFLTLFNFAFKLIELPQGVILSVFSIIFFPVLSSYASKNKISIFNDSVSLVCLMILIASLSIVIPSIKYAETVSYIAFGIIGELNIKELESLSDYFKFMIISIPFSGLSSFLIFAFAARKNISTPFFITLFSLAASYYFNEYFLRSLGYETLSLVFCHACLTLGLIFSFNHKYGLNIFKNYKYEFLRLVVVSLVISLALYYLPIFENQILNIILFASFILINLVAFNIIIRSPKRLLNVK